MKQDRFSGNIVFWAYLAVLIGVFGHASSEFVAVYSGVQGPEVSVWRFMIGGTGLVLFSLLFPSTRDLLTPLRENGLKIVPLAAFTMTLAQLIFHWSLDFATVIQVATMVTTMPIIVVIVSFLIFKTPITMPKLVSGFGAFCGIAFLLTDGYLEKLTGSGDQFVGVLMALTSALLGSVYMVLVRPLIQRYGAIRMTTLTFAIGAVVLWVVVGLSWDIWVDPTTLFERPPQAWGSLLAMGLWNTTIAMLLFLWGLSAAPDMGRANYLFFLKPVIAACLGVFILGQAVTGVQLLAIIVITCCVLVEIFWDQISLLATRARA